MAERAPHHTPGLPDIRDEAADTPLWVPVLGLVLLALTALAAVFRAAVGEDAPAEPTQEDQAAAAAAEPEDR